MPEQSIGRIAAIQQFMGSEKPVTNHELLDLKKRDPEGFDWMAEECARALGMVATPRAK